MKKPILLPTLSDIKERQAKRDLLDFFNYDTISNAKKALNIKYAKDIYQSLKNKYNETVTKINNKSTEKYELKFSKNRETKIKNMVKRNQEIQANIQAKRLQRPTHKNVNVIIVAKTYLTYKNSKQKDQWKDQEHSQTFTITDDDDLQSQIDNYINDFYPYDQSIGIVSKKNYTYQVLNDNVKNVNTLDVPMKRATPIKPAFLKWFNNIDNIAYKDFNDMCVPEALKEHLNIKKDKTINDVLQEACKKLYNKDWNVTDGVTARMIKYFCQQKQISCLGLNQKDRCFVKQSFRTSGKYKPIIFYMVAGHFYLITSNLSAISQTFKENNVIVSSMLDTEENKKTEYKYINIEEVIETEDMKLDIDEEEKEEEEEKFKTMFEKINQLDANTIVLFRKANLNEELQQYVKIYNTFVKVKYESKSNCKSIKLNNNIILATTEYLVDNKLIKQVCDNEEIEYKNQTLGTMLMDLSKKFFNKKSDRVAISKELKNLIIGKQDHLCKLCNKKAKKMQIDHIRPLANGGTNDVNNLQALCSDCHREKSQEEKLNCEYHRIYDYISSYNIEAYNTIKSSFFDKVQFSEYLLSENKINAYKEKNYKMYSIDDNKCRRNLLINYNYEFPVYSCLDNIKMFDGKLTNGYYYVETTNKFPLHQNGFYSLPMIEYCINNKIISKFDIKYQYKPSFTIPANYFKPFVQHLLNTFNEIPEVQKLAINSLVGMFGRRTNEYIDSAIVDRKNEDDVASYYVKFQKPYINELSNDFAVITQSINIDKLENAYPIYAQILDCEAIELHKKTELLKEKNFIPICIKTDAVVYLSKDGNKVDISNYYWDNEKTILKYKDEEITPLKKQIMHKPTKSFKLQSKQYNVIEDTKKFNFNLTIAEQIVNSNYGCFLDGMAGTGKTKLIKEIIRLLQGKNVKRLTPTNVSALLINGETIDKFANSILSNAKSISKLENVSHIFIDEVSMMKERFYSVFLSVKYHYPNIKFIISGDFQQLEPVRDRARFNYEYSKALHELADGNKVLLTLCRRSDDKLFNICSNIIHNSPYNIDDIQNLDWLSYKNLCFTNAKRIDINTKCMKRYLDEWKPSVTHAVSKLEYDGNTQDYTLCAGMPLISRLNRKSINVLNNEMFVCKKIKADTIIVTNEFKELEIQKTDFNKLFNLAFCITIHKSQGLSLNEKYVIYEWNRLNNKLKYVAISRATNIYNINIM